MSRVAEKSVLVAQGPYEYSSGCQECQGKSVSMAILSPTLWQTVLANENEIIIFYVLFPSEC